MPVPTSKEDDSRLAVAGCFLMLLTLVVMVFVAIQVVSWHRPGMVVILLPLLAGALFFWVGTAFLRVLGLSVEVEEPRKEAAPGLDDFETPMLPVPDASLLPEDAPLAGVPIDPVTISTEDAVVEPVPDSEPTGPPPPPPLPDPGFAGAVGWCLLLMLLAAVAGVLCFVVVRVFLRNSPETVQYFVTGSLSTLLAAVALVGRPSETEPRERLALRLLPARHILLVVLLAPPLGLLSVEAANVGEHFFSSESAETPGAPLPGPLPVPLSIPGWREMFHDMAGQSWVLILLAGCLLPALAEEPFFRGFLGRGLVARHGPVLGVLLTSLLFGLMHIDPVRICATAVAGIGIHVVYLTTRSLAAPILLHTLHNALMFAVARVARDAELDLTGQYDGMHLPLMLVLASAIAVVVLLFVFYRMRTRWLLPDGQEWSPGYVSAEMPPPGFEACASPSRPGPGPLLSAAAGYLAFASVALFYLFPGTPRGAWDYVNRGNEHLERGEYDTAIADYTEAIRLAPNDPAPYYNRGLILVQKGQHAEALPDLDRAIELDPTKKADAYLQRGLARHHLGRHDEALADYGQVLCLNPREEVACTNRALIRWERRDLDGALADLNEALRLKRTAARLVLRGQLHLQKNAPEKAIRDFNEAIRMEPRNAEAFYLRGCAFQMRGDETQAQDDFKEASRLDPDIAKRFQ